MSETVAEAALAATIEQAYRTMTNDPQSLLEVDGGPIGRTASIVVARLYGFDEQLDAELRVQRAEAVLLRAITPRVEMVAADPDPAPYAPAFPTAEYVLQSGYASAWLGGVYVPPGVPLDPQFRASVLCLRYKRRR